MIDFIGDLSAADAEVLRTYSRQAKKGVLEFGVGGSTQIMARNASVPIITVETDPEWIDKTKNNIELLSIKPKHPIVYLNYGDTINHTYDLAFIDCICEKRLEAALQAWSGLPIGGNILFHDTRRYPDINNVCNFLKYTANSVETVVFNVSDGVSRSNITVVSKCEEVLWENWNNTEQKNVGRLVTQIYQNKNWN